MPTVPGSAGSAQELAEQQAQADRPTPEQLLMTAADMKSRGQLYTHPTDYSDPKASLKLPNPGGGRGPKLARSHGKRR